MEEWTVHIATLELPIRLPDGSFSLVITGNQIAAILVDYLLYAHQQAGTLQVTRLS